MNTIANLLGLTPVAPYKSSKATALECADPSLVYGVELEIEGVPEWDEMLVSGIVAVDDNSLRNNGKEFITKPMTYSILAYTLGNFFKKNKLDVRNYSERTSVHVHANCQDMTQQQLSTLCLLYELFEPLLYRFIGHERHDNIFCVPWSESGITYSIIRQMVEKQDVMAARRWMKYSGLNLLPLYSQGTVEFRHMSGNADPEYILLWCNLIGSLFAYAKKSKLEDVRKEILELNTTSGYQGMLTRVFTTWSFAVMGPGFERSLEEGVLSVKYSLLNTARKRTQPGVVLLNLNNAGEAERAFDTYIHNIARRSPPPAYPDVDTSF